MELRSVFFKFGSSWSRDHETCAARVYSRVLQEFNDDQDYLNEFEEIRKTQGLVHREVAPKFRQDFEKTEMVDLSKMDEMLKKK